MSGNDDEDVKRPRDILVADYVKERIVQIAELLEATDNSSLIGGEVTKGPRTAVQRLPRNLRRRAMSYNIKRFPRNQRRFASAVIAASKHRKKPPSRFWRRRPRNLLMNYVRRQRKLVWLETHVWHAKRFRMVSRWGYRLPFYSWQRAFRPSYRDSMRHCAVHDVSYMRCFQISTSNQRSLIEKLRCLCQPSASATFAFKAALNGRMETPVLLYEPSEYPSGFIGPARFLWCRPNSAQWTLSLWCHPSCSSIVLQYLIEILRLHKVDDADNEKNDPKIHRPRTIEGWRQQNMRVLTDKYTSEDGFEMTDLSDQLVRYRLYGPMSLSVLSNVLNVVKPEDAYDSWMKSYRQSNETWMSDVRFHSPGEFLDGTIISLLVEDPRITRPTHKRKPTPRTAHRKQLSVLDELPVPPSEFWDLNLRCKMLDSKMSQDELQEMRSHNLAPILTTKAKVPVLLIIRNANTGTSSSFTGVDLLLPSGFGMDFWVALQYGTAHAVALRDHRAIHFESDRLCFPTDFVDCVAGSNDLLEETQERVEKYLLRPHNRRIRYWSRLSVKYPFSFNLNELACDWAGETNGGHKLHILRDRKQLLLIERWLLGKAPEPVDLLNSFPLALIPVRLDVLTTGRPVRYALICVPIDSDFDLSRVNNIDKKRVIDEPCNVSVSANEVDDEDCNELANSDGMTESYIELQDHSKEELISLCSLFPDKQQQRKRKILLQRKESRKRSKAAKMQKKAMEYESKEKGGLEPEKEDGDLKSDTKSGLIGSDDMPTFRKSCSREIIGRVMRGSYGLSCGRGKGLGYCTLCGLREVRNRQVLFRNVTSKHYHPALISVLRTLPDL